MLGIKDKKRKNDDNELSKHSQNAKIVIRQKSYATLEKIIQHKTRIDNEKIFNHEFNENDAVGYTALIEKKRIQNKNLKAKKEY